MKKPEKEVSQNAPAKNIDIANCQRSKQRWLMIFGISLSGFVFCMAAIFVPWLNDAFSGRPHYLRALAESSAESLANQLSGLYPVIVLEEPILNCSPIQGSRQFLKVYYVVRFSEVSNSLCTTKYGDSDPLSGSPDTVLSENMGRNFGSRLTSPVSVFAVEQNLIHFPDSVLVSLYWKDSSRRGEESSQAAAQVLQGMHLELGALKARIARRHFLTNDILFCGGVIWLFMAIYLLRQAYTEFVSLHQHCSALDYQLSLMTYLGQNLTDVLARVHSDYQQRQAQILSQSRAERILRRSYLETRELLSAHLEGATDQQRRTEIENCLREDNLDKMKAFLEDLEVEPTDSPPIIRLASLLGYLEDYCSDEEFASFSTEANGLLAQQGFRAAREFVVRVNKELRIRAREKEEERIANEQSEG